MPDSIFDARLTDVIAIDAIVDKDTKAVKSAIQIVPSDQPTFIIVAVLHHNIHNNQLIKIKCDAGNPLGGYVYDTVNRCYYLKCLEYYALGYIDVSYYLKIKGNDFWRTRIPLPENVICRYLSKESLEKLKSFKARYKGAEYYFQFIQMIG
jgi:hypothetical protein